MTTYAPDVYDKGYYGCGLDDRTDDKWAHPQLKNHWIAGNADFIEFLLDTEEPLEDRLKKIDKVNRSTIKFYEKTGYKPFEGQDDIKGGTGYGVLKEFTCKGCPEDPDIETRVFVVEPNEKKDELRPVLFYVMGGGYFQHLPGIYPEILGWAKKFDCVVVTAEYSNMLVGRYPKMINEQHAAYCWMLEHVKEFGGDPDNVVLTGESGGAQFALNLAFRLKRHGIIPRGVVVSDPLTDDRAQFESSKIVKLPAYHGRLHAMWSWYYGPENTASPYLGPEAFANHATVEQCKGLPPIVINIGESDMDRDATMEFVSKLYAARVPTSLHVWEGVAHGSLWFTQENENRMAKRFWDNFFGDIQDHFEFDMRRPWAWDAEKEAKCGEVEA